MTAQILPENSPFYPSGKNNPPEAVTLMPDPRKIPGIPPESALFLLSYLKKSFLRALPTPLPHGKITLKENAERIKFL